MPEFHAEPYVYLPTVTHKSALIAWGAFYFRVSSKGRWKLVDDTDLRFVHPPRKDSIGACSAPYGPARVEVYDAGHALVSSAQAAAANHCWVTGLAPDTEYTYRVFVKDDEWASGERWDWSAPEHSLVQTGARYDNRFRTHPDPAVPAASLTFAVIGDFGVGVKTASTVRCQQQIADSLRRAVDERAVRLLLTTGDNIYASKRLFGIPLGSTGDEDDDWFFTYFQPYRYIINRIPVYPSIGNHDSDETEACDDRTQLEDNFYIRERIMGEEASGRASFGPGLFYTVRYGSNIEFICLDTSKESFFRSHRLFEFPKHWEFVEASFPPSAPASAGGRDSAAAGSGAAPSMWRIPFAHHPPYSAGPQHHNTRDMARLFPLFQRSGVRVMFSGHEHNFQHARAGGVDYFVTGAAGKFRGGSPDRLEEAHTRSWSASCHFLLVRIEGGEMIVRALGGPPGEDIERRRADGLPVTGPMTVGG